MRSLGEGHFCSSGHNLNKLGRRPLGDARLMLHTKYQGCMSSGFKQEDIFMFPYISLSMYVIPML